MKQNNKDLVFNTLKLGSLGNHKTKSPFYIRLIYPINYPNDEVVNNLIKQIANGGNDCEWEIIPKITSVDSFLGSINLGSIDGLDPFFDQILYKSPDDFHIEGSPYLFFRLGNKHLQYFQKLFYKPAKQQEIELRMLSCEFFPFRNKIGFICVSFSCPNSENQIPFKTAVDLNYYLPYVCFNCFPLKRIKQNKSGKKVETKFYIPSLFQKLYESLEINSTRKRRTSVQECWGKRIEIEDRKGIGNEPYLFFMSYAVLNVSDKDWENKVEDAKHFYHQITRWSEDSYSHEIPPDVEGFSPEKTKSGIPTRSYAFRERGLTCIGLGASEFESNNYLPKFRESYLFALLLAWNFRLARYTLTQSKLIENKIPQCVEALRELIKNDIYKRKPRQQFFEDSLKFYLGNNYKDEIDGCFKTFSPKEDEEIIASETIISFQKTNKYIFRKDGDIWHIVYNGCRIPSLKDRDGLYYIWYLLKNCNKEISVEELYRARKKPDNSKRRKEKEFWESTQENEEKKFSPLGNMGENIDEEAREDNIERLKELQQEIASAKKNNDFNKQEKLEEEKGKIVQYLSKVGKYNIIVSPERDKSRKAVSNAITRTIKAIEKENSSLAIFLGNSINKGFNCCYTSKEGVIWEL